MRIVFSLLATAITMMAVAEEKFPDGTPIPSWFKEEKVINISSLGESFIITNYGVIQDSNIVQTSKIQAVIDRAAERGGVVIIPKGTFLSGSLFFKPNTHLYLAEGATLKGSDDISDFALIPTRIEGQSVDYFAALVNADNVDGFTISGKGTLDGNGMRYWKSFWLRRKYNPNCTNMEEMRPRLIYISNSKNVHIDGIRVKNSPFWSTHYYRCENLRLTNMRITSPKAPVKAPSTDGMDFDVCENVHVDGCYISVNDDAIALKGGKGPWANDDKNNGSNKNIIIENCLFGFCHGVLTCGSESIHNRNVIVRHCEVDDASRLLWLKMRPDTPQNYEYILFDDIRGNARNFIYVAAWTQFFDLKGRTDIPISTSSNITMKNIKLSCDRFFNVEKSDKYVLKNFMFENIDVEAQNGEIDKSAFEKIELINLNVR